MMRHFIRVMGIIIALALLLAIIVGSARARHGQSKASPIPTGDAERAEDTALLCLALVGSAALLAGVVWMGKLRHIMS
nr:hypothetical protein [Anaerolineae bacterium]